MQLVEAVKSTEDVKRVADLLRKHSGDIYADCWVVGVNMALRISDLLEIKMQDALSGVVVLKEGKTGKRREIKLNSTALAVVERRAKDNPQHEWLFQVESNRAKDKPISRFAVARKFSEIGDIVGVKLGTHSMRKTLGWVMHSNGASIERICKVLNHSNPAITMHYIGLTQEDVNNAYHEFEIKF